MVGFDDKKYIFLIRLISDLFENMLSSIITSSKTIIIFFLGSISLLLFVIILAFANSSFVNIIFSVDG